jgi:hypothetical protein
VLSGTVLFDTSYEKTGGAIMAPPAAFFGMCQREPSPITHYNKTKTAQALGISRTMLYQKLGKYGIQNLTG